MISEQEKQAILNGAYGITIEGKKVKYIGKRELDNGEYAFPYFFVILSENGNISRSTYLSEDLTYALGDGNNHEIVGLWGDKPEPFNINKALNGEPVKLRCGLKAYIKYDLPSEYKGKHPLNGYYIDPENPKELVTEHWARDGKAFIFEDKHDLDIIGMWKEPEPVSNTVTITIPRPLTEPKDEMWFIRLDGYTKSSYGKNIPLDHLKLRYYFGSEADAQAWLDAIQNSRR